ncbi:MAG: hypothetical protein CFE43_21205 [Burkholderiales bacterium PBB3]|nr:MAG: hypothetical protein CFE43_21205 [Burkholderiales bacterium PBB3]
MHYANSSFGGLVAAIRRNKNLTGRKLAARLHVSPTRLSAIENSRVPPPSLEVVQKIGEALGCNFAELRSLEFAARSETLAADIDKLFPSSGKRRLAKTAIQSAELLSDHESDAAEIRLRSLVGALTCWPPSISTKEDQAM